MQLLRVTLIPLTSLTLPSFLLANPVEDEYRKVLTEALENAPELKEATEKEVSLLLEEMLNDFNKASPKWTAEDAAKLKAGKPLVEDFLQTKLKFLALERKSANPPFIDLARDPYITEVQKRMLVDSAHLFELPDTSKQTKQVVSNMKDIYVALREYAFNNDGATPGKIKSTKSSNEILRALFTTGIVRDEAPFSLPGHKGFTQGDDKLWDRQTLAAGENIFAYRPGINIQKANPNTPLLMFPISMDPKTKKLVTDNRLNGDIIVLYSDGACISYREKSKLPFTQSNGLNILSKEHPIWKEQNLTPNFRLPEKIEK